MSKKPAAAKPSKKSAKSAPEASKVEAPEVIVAPVEVCAEDFGQSEILTVKLDTISVPPKSEQVRPFDPEDAKYIRKVEFARSNRKWVNPITAARMPDGKLVLLAGRNRFEAAKACGWVEIEVRVYEKLDLGQRMAIGLIENLSAKEMTPVEIGVAVQAIMREDRKATVEVLARRMNCTPNTVRNYLQLNGLVTKASKMTAKGEIPAANAYYLARLPEDVQLADEGAWIDSASKTGTVKFVKAVQDYLKKLKGDKTGAVRKSSKAAAQAAPETEKPIGQRKLENMLAEAMEANSKVVPPMNESFQDGLIDGLRIALGRKPLLPATCVPGYQPKAASARTE